MNSKRSAFTAVMYWNFLRLSVALLYHIIGLIDILGLISVSPYVIVTLKTFVNIALSYVITVDAEIVKSIEGRDTKKDSFKKKKIDTSSKSVSTTSSMSYLPKDPPRYSARTSHNSSLAKSNNNEFDDDKFTVSMKKLSFFEWANTVVGKRFKNNDELSEEVDIEVIDIKDEVKDKTNIEVVIDNPSNHSEKDDSQKKTTTDINNN